MLELLRGCVHTSLRREVVASWLLLRSDVTASALILLVLVSITLRNVTFVPIAGSLLPKLRHELGKTNISVPSSTFMKPKVVSFVFMIPLTTLVLFIIGFE